MNRIVVAALLVFGIATVTYLVWPKHNDQAVIIKMQKSGASETELLKSVEAANADPVNADNVIELKDAGVPNSVIIKMLQKAGDKNDSANGK